jgi:FAD dependent oxidoreductase
VTAISASRQELKVGWNFEPHVADQVFHEMLREAKVTLVVDSRLREKGGVAKQQGRIVGITLEDGTVVQAKVFADFTYEGDLIAEAPAASAWVFLPAM